ncbi:putative baseplate assembly protein [Pseudoduganella sp. HUAS MS19]
MTITNHAACTCAGCGGSDPLCGCCGATGTARPPARANRPGLDALSYRLGIHTTFLGSMLARLTGMRLTLPAGENGPSEPLKRLTTRDRADPAIALLDGWATVADVLTFYQERIANEAYLRTATERQSVADLARLVGYRLRPGVAASVHLAFTVADGFRGELPQGTRAQSVPGAGQLPQFFETDEKLEARDSWNALKPRLTRPQVISLPFTGTSLAGQLPTGTEANVIGTLYLRGTSSNLKIGDPLLIVLGRGRGQQVVRFVESVAGDASHGRTKVTLQETPFRASFGRQALDNVRMAVQPYIAEAASIFAANLLAQQVADLLQALIDDAAQSNGTVEAVLPLVRSAIAQVSERHDLTQRRHFTRLEPWLSDLLDTLDTLAGQLPLLDASVPDPQGPVTTTVPAQRAISPLRRLAPLLEPLSRPASLQPANSRRLGRSVARAFARQSDMAPRLLARFHPVAAEPLYQAWGSASDVMQKVSVHALRVRAPLYGNSAPPRITGASDGVVTSYGEWQVVEPAEGGGNVFHEREHIVSLDNAYEKVVPQSWVVVDTRAVDSSATRIVRSPGLLVAWAGVATAAMARSDYGMSGKSTRVELLDPASHNALAWLDLSHANEGAGEDFDAIRNTIVYANAEELELAEEPLDADIEGDTIVLAGLYDGLETGRSIIISGLRTDISGTSGVSASELAMIAAVAQGTRGAACALYTAPGMPFAQLHYVSEANRAGDRLVVGRLAAPSSLKSLPLPAMANQLYCDQLQLAPGLYATAYVPSQAERDGDYAAFNGLLLDPLTGEALPNGRIPPTRTTKDGLWAWRVSSAPPNTILTLANRLAYTYDSSTVTIHGNVARASQGQTTGEVLGDGDAAQALQRFTLRQGPLTFVSAPTPSGIGGTLEVRVNDVLWHQAMTLDELSGTAHGYMLQTVTGQDGSDSTSIVFGDGVHGARLPTGSANVKALYRYGMGKSGNVKARQISQLATHPLGAQAVINPLPASGGADADNRDQLRRNAPLAAMALDRLVSTQDYADFTRYFAGIGKSSAARISDGRRQLTHVTIAGADDIPVDPGSDLYRNLLSALGHYGDPHLPVQVALRRLKLLVMHARIQVHADYLWDAVEPVLRAALLHAFGFEQRELGQDAIRSEALAVMQAVEGIAYVDLRVFDSVSESIGIDELAGLADTLTSQPRVVAELARSDGANGVRPAELVILTPDIPDTLILTEVSR